MDAFDRHNNKCTNWNRLLIMDINKLSEELGYSDAHFNDIL
jgi:hypothetical protein